MKYIVIIYSIVEFHVYTDAAVSTNSAPSEPLPITPSYLKHPPFPHGRSSAQKPGSYRTNANGLPTQPPAAESDDGKRFFFFFFLFFFEGGGFVGEGGLGGGVYAAVTPSMQSCPKFKGHVRGFSRNKVRRLKLG